MSSLIAHRPRRDETSADKVVSYGLETRLEADTELISRCGRTIRLERWIRRGADAGSQNSDCTSPQMLMAWPEIVRPRGDARNSIMSASCCGAISSLIDACDSASS
jgi:hypothetical protein